MRCCAVAVAGGGVGWYRVSDSLAVTAIACLTASLTASLCYVRRWAVRRVGEEEALLNASCVEPASTRVPPSTASLGASFAYVLEYALPRLGALRSSGAMTRGDKMIMRIFIFFLNCIYEISLQMIIIIRLC